MLIVESLNVRNETPRTAAIDQDIEMRRGNESRNRRLFAGVITDSNGEMLHSTRKNGETVAIEPQLSQCFG